MSAEAIGWVFRHSPVTGAAFQVHLALADSANDQNGYELWMRVRTIAQKARLSEGAVRRALAELIDQELLVVLDDGRSRDDAQSATRARRFALVMPDGRPAIYEPGRRAYPTASPEGSPDARLARAHGAGDPRTLREPRAHGAGDLEPKEDPKENPSSVSSSREQLTLVGTESPAARPEQHLAVGQVLGSDRDLAFVEFWRRYPHKTGKGQARKAWAAARRRGVLPEVIVAGADRYREDPNRDPAFTKHPATWLNGECWDDEPLPDKRPAGQKGGGRMGETLRQLQRVASPSATGQLSAAAQARRALGSGQ